MTGVRQELSRQLTQTLRRIIRGVELRSRDLVRRTGLTGPQLQLLGEIGRAGRLTMGELAARVSISPATANSVLKRLEAGGLVNRERQLEDRRRVRVTLTAEGEKVVAQSPPLLHETLLEAVENFDDEELGSLLDVLDRVAELMGVPANGELA